MGQGEKFFGRLYVFNYDGSMQFEPIDIWASLPEAIFANAFTSSSIIADVDLDNDPNFIIITALTN